MLRFTFAGHNSADPEARRGLCKNCAKQNACAAAGRRGAPARHASCNSRDERPRWARPRSDRVRSVRFTTGTNMTIDLNKEWSAAEISALLASVEDDRSWRLEVTTDGIAKLNDLTTVPPAAYEARFIAASRSGIKGRTSSARALRATSLCARCSNANFATIIRPSRVRGRFRRYDGGGAGRLPVLHLL